MDISTVFVGYRNYFNSMGDLMKYLLILIFLLVACEKTTEPEESYFCKGMVTSGSGIWDYCTGQHPQGANWVICLNPVKHEKDLCTKRRHLYQNCKN